MNSMLRCRLIGGQRSLGVQVPLKASPPRVRRAVFVASAVEVQTQAPPRPLMAQAPSTLAQSPDTHPAKVELLSASSPAAEQHTASGHVQYELDARTGLQRLKYDRNGWEFWNWTDASSGKTHKVHYVQAGDKGPVVVLVHGYGASSYHWRYNIPALAQHCRVYAVDMLGFGWSDKALVDYSSGGVWSRQLSSFIKEVAGGGPAVLVGNSLGGFASMATAAQYPEVVRAVAVLNGAGPFEDQAAPAGPMSPEAPPLWYEPLTSLVRRGAMQVAFLQARQPARIRQVLSLVYTDQAQLDDDLVDSIVQPAQDPQAYEVFYRVNTQRGASTVTVNSALRQMGAVHMPLLLLWGDLDPWMRPSRAAKIQELYPAAERVGLQTGHCPHDDSPAESNAALLSWLDKIPPLVL